MKPEVTLNDTIVGRNVFFHKSGIRTAGVIRNPFAYEPYPPEIIGAVRTDATESQRRQRRPENHGNSKGDSADIRC
ncbi:MAG: homocitrate synthase/isopropylmalate synthase family protein [Alphaproteobacteria bacterium]